MGSPNANEVRLNFVWTLAFFFFVCLFDYMGFLDAGYLMLDPEE